jgi:hypothetical protein
MEIEREEIEREVIEPKTNPSNYIGLFNTEKKKKPHNITFKNFNPNEPKINVNMKYSDKQKYRRYKTKTEPKLLSKIMVDDEEDLIAKIRKEFGIKDTKKKNYSDVETSGMQYYDEPNPRIGEQADIIEMMKFYDLTDISTDDFEEFTGEIRQYDLANKKEDVADEDVLPFDDKKEEEEEDEDEEEEEEDEEEEEEEDDDMSRSEIEEITGESLDTQPEPLMREASRGTVLSALTTKEGVETGEDLETLSLDDLYIKRDNLRGTGTRGPKIKNMENMEKKRKELIAEIQELMKSRGAAP